MLVVLGHAIQSNIADYDNNIIFAIIYSFHMPLFMFISGLVAYHPNKEISIKTLVKRAVSLGVPFFSYTVIVYFTRGCYRHETIVSWVYKCIKTPDLSLWFLWVLFLCYIALFMTTKFTAICGELIYAGALLFCMRSYFLGDYWEWGGSFCIWYFPFFLGGYLCSKYKGYIITIKKGLFLFSMIFFFPVEFYWRRTGGIDILNFLNIESGGGCIYLWAVRGYNYLAALLGIVFCFAIVYCLISEKLINILAFIGKHSLTIYFFNVWSIELIKSKNLIINIFFGTWVGIIVPIIVESILERNRAAGFLILGKIKK